MRKNKLKLGGRWIFLVLVPAFVLTASTGAFAVNFSGKAGCVTPGMGLSPVGTVKDSDNSTPLPANGVNKVEFISLGPDGRIDGPAMNGSVTGDDVLLGTFNVGEDSVGGNFSGTAGKFWHSISGATGGNTVNSFYVRAWNNLKTIDNAYFRESAIFDTATAAIGFLVPDNNPLPDFATIFPKAAPTGPINTAAGAPVFNAASIKWEAPLSWNTAFGARKYEIYKVDDAGGTNPQLLDTIHNQNGYPSPDNTTPIPWTWLNLNQSTAYFFFVRAVNSFGATDSTVVSFTTLAYPDLTVPVAVTNLQATYNPATTPPSITLTWTPPYDLNNEGALGNCLEYDIRVARNPIISAPQSPFTAGQTNPPPDTPTDTWNSAKPLTDTNLATEFGLTPLANLPTPQVYQAGGNYNTDTVTITGPALSSTYYFALKATDSPATTPADQKRWSYISNVAGVSLPTSKAHSLGISLGDSVNDLTLSWTCNTAADIYRSNNQNNGYSLPAGDNFNNVTSPKNLPNQTIEDPDYAVFYRIVPHGDVPIGAGGSTPSVTVGKVKHTFTKAAGGYGINTLSFPFQVISGTQTTSPGSKNIVTALDLIREIKSQQGDVAHKTAVTMFGYWDQTAQKAVGFILTYPNGADADPHEEIVHAGVPNTPGTLSDVIFSELSKDQPYQISIADPTNPAAAITINFELAVKL